MKKGGAPSYSLTHWIGWCLAWMMIMILIGFSPAASQGNLRYYLEIDEDNWNAFHVNIIVSNNRAAQLYCGLPQGFVGPDLTPAPGCDISKFEVTDRFGAALSFQAISCNTWLIETQGNDIVNISYQVNGRKDLILGDRLSRSFARVDPSTVFLFIREYLNAPIFLSVRVPNRWKLASGLAATEQAFEYRLLNYNQLLRHPLYLAPFEEIYFKLEDRICYILIDGSKTPEINKLSSIATRVAYYQSQLFREIPFDRYLFIFKVFSAQPVIASAAYDNVSIYYFSYDHLKNNFDNVALSVASSFFRNWQGYQFGLERLQSQISTLPATDSGSLLLHYGFNEYYAGLTLVRIGYWSEMDFINHQIQTINRYQRGLQRRLAPSAKSQSPLVVQWEDADLELLKMRGQLIALLLDLKIREASSNQRSLDDVVFFLNQWFCSRKLSYQDEDVFRAILAVAGVNLRRFFDLYISGTQELPLIETLQSAGILMKTANDSMPDLGEFQLTPDSNVFVQIGSSSPLNVAGVKVGDRLISINNRAISSLAQLNRFLETMTIGQDLNIAVYRDGAPLILIARVSSKPVVTTGLVSSSPQTELQHKIRSTWLAKQLP